MTVLVRGALHKVETARAEARGGEGATDARGVWHARRTLARARVVAGGRDAPGPTFRHVRREEKGAQGTRARPEAVREGMALWLPQRLHHHPRHPQHVLSARDSGP